MHLSPPRIDAGGFPSVRRSSTAANVDPRLLDLRGTLNHRLAERLRIDVQVTEDAAV
jgi:hypothetical protein